jgi:hypothetical protein
MIIHPAVVLAAFTAIGVFLLLLLPVDIDE